MVVIRTRMYCSVGMQQSCTRWPRQLFPVNNEKVEEKGKEEEEEEEEEEEKGRGRRRSRRGGGGGGGDQN